MKIEILNPRLSDDKSLSSVNFDQFATDSAGKIYFAPSQRWVVYDPVTGKVEEVKYSSEVSVTVLPIGTRLQLTSTN